MTFPRRKTFVYFALSLALIAVAVGWIGVDQKRTGSHIKE